MTAAPDNPSPKATVQCPHCRRSFAAPRAYLGRTARCPKCATPFTLAEAPANEPVLVPLAADAEVEETKRTGEQENRKLEGAGVIPGAGAGITPGVLCPICQSALDPAAIKTCPDCHTRYHQDCWDYNKGCGVYGCPQVPPTEKLDTLEIPAAYWGQEEKPCPLCGQTILAAAVRCRHCGATFGTARPQGRDEFRGQTAIEVDTPRVQKTCVWLLVFSLIPCSAPIAAVFGLVWFYNHRATIAKLPALYRALCHLAPGVAVLQSVLMIVVATIHAIAG